MFIYHMCMSAARGGQKRVLEPLQLELQMIAKPWIWVLGTELWSSRGAESASIY